MAQHTTGSTGIILLLFTGGIVPVCTYVIHTIQPRQLDPNDHAGLGRLLPTGILLFTDSDIYI